RGVADVVRRSGRVSTPISCCFCFVLQSQSKFANYRPTEKAVKPCRPIDSPSMMPASCRGVFPPCGPDAHGGIPQILSVILSMILSVATLLPFNGFRDAGAENALVWP